MTKAADEQREAMSDSEIERLAIEVGLDNELWFGRDTPSSCIDSLPMLVKFARAIESAALSAQSVGREPGWFLPDSAINEPMRDGLQALWAHAKRARWTNATVRKDSVETVYEADWIKHMRRASPTSSIAAQVPKAEGEATGAVKPAQNEEQRVLRKIVAGEVARASGGLFIDGAWLMTPDQLLDFAEKVWNASATPPVAGEAGTVGEGDSVQLRICPWRGRGLGCGNNVATWCCKCPKRNDGVVASGSTRQETP